MAAYSIGREHRVQQVLACGANHGKKAAKPEKLLNCFVRSVAFIERVGNALGTLSFTWATVILLGGYPTMLREQDDFWCATAIVFLEAIRMFSRNNRLDYQLFFYTKGAFRPLGWNRLILIVYLSHLSNYLYMWAIQLVEFPKNYNQLTLIIPLAAPSVFCLLQSTRALKLIAKPLNHAISLCSPLVAILLLPPLIFKFTPTRKALATWILFTLLFLSVLLLTISRLRFQRNIKPAEHALIKRQVFCHRLILNLCMLVELLMLVFMFDDLNISVVGYIVYASVFLSIANLQIPAAVTRVILSGTRLGQDYNSDNAVKDPSSKVNLEPSLTIFYGMVLGQGALYVVACMLEIFSVIPRRCLARRGGLRGQWGAECVDLYYAYALEKSMEGDVLAPKKINLDSFSMYLLNSDAPKMQLYGIRIMHSLLRKDATRKRLLSKLTTSTITMARAIEMLDWTSPEDTTIRLFAAKVIAEIAKSLHVVTIPGTLRLVSALLDDDRKSRRECPLLDSNYEQVRKQDIFIDTTNTQEERLDLIMVGGYDNRRQRQDPLGDPSNLMETQASSNQQVGIDEQNSCFLRSWKWMSIWWSSPKVVETPADSDNLPALGMSILNSLACSDYGNCVEISREADLMPKIIEFASFKNCVENSNEARQKVLMESSLTLLQRLSNTGGEIGITLRRKISEHPVLMRNLAEILNDRCSSQELRKLVAGIVRNLSIDGNTSQEIGRIQVIIWRLMDEFLSREEPSSTDSDQILQKVAGQALAMLTMESSDNCAAILMAQGHLIGELASMVTGNKHKYVAARLLQNLFLHTQPEFSKSNLEKLCETLGKVVETVVEVQADEAELEVLIGLSSQIYKVIPEDYARELVNGHQREIFAKRLVDALRANMDPAVHCPGIRRVIIEQSIYLMKYSSHYAKLFNQYCMMEALLMVEQTPSRVERYRIFLGNTGFMPHKEPITILVATAKELMCRR